MALPRSRFSPRNRHNRTAAAAQQKSRQSGARMRAGGDFKRFPFATPEALGDSGLDFAALAHVKENITVRALLWAPSPQDGAPKTQNVMQITYDAALCSYVPDHEMYSFGRRRAAMTWS